MRLATDAARRVLSRLPTSPTAVVELPGDPGFERAWERLLIRPGAAQSEVREPALT